MILGCSALLFGVLAVPLVALGRVEFPAIDFFGDDRELRPTSTTLGALPASQCSVLRSVRDAGNAAFAATFEQRSGIPWSEDRARTDVLLARYEFTLQSARASLPPQFGDDLREVAESVHFGRATLAASPTRSAYRDHVVPDVMRGFSALTDIEAQLGSACGERFTFWPHGALEVVAG